MGATLSHLALAGGRDDERHAAHAPARRVGRDAASNGCSPADAAGVALACARARGRRLRRVLSARPDRLRELHGPEFLEGIEPTTGSACDNYATSSRHNFRDSVGVTVKFTVITVSFELVLGLIIALVVNSNFKGRGVMRAAMLVPWAIPTVVSAQMWKWMYHDIYGVFNDLCVDLHILPPGRLDRGPRSRPVAAVDIWKTTPFVALLLLAGLQVIPGDIYEAAGVDGASPCSSSGGHAAAA